MSQEMYIASKNGELERLKRAVENWEDVNRCSDDGTSALVTAIWYGQRKCAEYLLQNNADPNKIAKPFAVLMLGAAKPADFMDTPLVHAYRKGDMDLVQMLLVDYKVDPNKQEECVNGDTPMLRALYHSHHGNQQKLNKFLEILFSQGADLNLQNAYGESPLMRTVGKKFSKAMKMLLENGAEIEDKDNENETALYIAVRDQNYEAIEALLQKKADVNYTDHLNGHIPRGWSPLMCSVGNNDIKTMEKLIQHGANVNYITHYSSSDIQNTALLLVMGMVGSNQFKAAEMLLKNKANVNSQDSLGNTPLMKAIQNGSFQLIQLIFKYVGNQNSRKTLATNTNQNIECDLQNNKGESALLIATMKHQILPLKLLLQNGASANIQDFEGRTALYVAAKSGFHQAISELINHGAERGIADYHAVTPLEIARQNKHTQCVALLCPESERPSSSADSHPPIGVNESAIDRYLRASAKLITTDDKLIAVGLQLNFSYGEIEAIRTDNRENIVVAGFKLLQKWKQKYFSLSTIQEELAPAFREIELEYDFRKILPQEDDEESTQNDDNEPVAKKRRPASGRKRLTKK